MTTEVSTSTTETPRSEMQRQHHHGDRHQPAFLLLAPEVHGGGQIRALLFKVHAASVIHQGARTHARSGQDHGRLLLPAVPTSQAGQSMDCFPLLQGQQQTTSIKVRCSCPHARMQDAASSTPLHGHLLSHYTIVDGQEKGFIMPCTSALASSAPAQRRWFFSASATEQPRCSFLGVVALLCFVAMNTPWVLLHLTSTRFQFGTNTITDTDDTGFRP